MQSPIKLSSEILVAAHPHIAHTRTHTQVHASIRTRTCTAHPHTDLDSKSNTKKLEKICKVGKRFLGHFFKKISATKIPACAQVNTGRFTLEILNLYFHIYSWLEIHGCIRNRVVKKMELKTTQRGGFQLNSAFFEPFCFKKNFLKSEKCPWFFFK